MSNYDAGHYFLTVLAPIRQGSVPLGPEGNGGSHVVALRRLLFGMATARQDRVNRHQQADSPFARVPGVHFARLFILPDLPFNGRAPSNAVLNLLRGADLVHPGAVDHLPQGWLVFVLDVDAPDGSEASLRAITDRLWQGMEAELRAVFRHCEGFDDGTQMGPEAWFAYVRRCQVTTTMPYNDYWIDAPPASPLKRLLLIAAGVIAAGAVGLPLAGLWPIGIGWLVLIAPLLFALAAIGIILRLGTTPFPPAPDSDLGSILKALHVQDRFGQFARAVQGNPPEVLQAEFARFMAEIRPSQTESPRQAPGRLPERPVHGDRP